MRDRFKRAVKAAATIALAGVIALGAPAADVFARTLQGADNWYVTFTSGKKMESNFKSSNITDVIYGMQPGDDAVINIDLSNTYGESTNWYMYNKVIKSLEDRSYNSQTEGGAYAYRLVYTSPEGKETVLFDSDRVGGENLIHGREGLNQATDTLEDYFFLDDLSTGQKAHIRLTVALDGETQGNDYQDTLADLQMQFAVELGATPPSDNPPPSNNPPTPNTPTTPNTPSNPTTVIPSNQTPRSGSNVVKTYDDSHVSLWVIIAGISGLVLLAIGIYSFRVRRLEMIAAMPDDDDDDYEEGGDGQ